MRLLTLFRSTLGNAATLKFVVRRIMISIPVVVGVILAAFMLARAMPGKPFENVGSKRMPPETQRMLNARFGLDRPLFLNFPSDGVVPDNDRPIEVKHLALPDCDQLRAGISPTDQNPQEFTDTYDGWQLLRMVQERRESTVDFQGKPARCLQSTTLLYSDLFRSQFFEYLFNALRLDFGPSLSRATLGQPVIELIGDRLPVSMKLGFLSVLVAFVLGVPLGVLSALRRNTTTDYVITFTVVTWQSIPTLVLAPLMILILVTNLKVMPTPDPRVWKGTAIFDPEFISRAALPILVLGTGIATGVARLTRASVLQVLRDDYIRTARAKGLAERIVIYVHALKNALIPVATIIGPLLADVLTGSLIIERIFAIPGLGDSFVNAVAARDYNLLLGTTILYALFLIAGNIFVDLMYTWLDPRIRFD